ncbi:MAG: hypothetical protein R2716_05850 [Microthrixaceae bacterium]
MGQSLVVRDHERMQAHETPDDSDPVLVRRRKLLRATQMAQRIGYSCFALAMVLFVVALVTQLPTWLVTTIVALMVAGSIVLLPAIILSYGAKAADREDRGEPFRY